jgi:hypothetical protein
VQKIIKSLEYNLLVKELQVMENFFVFERFPFNTCRPTDVE